MGWKLQQGVTAALKSPTPSGISITAVAGTDIQKLMGLVFSLAGSLAMTTSLHATLEATSSLITVNALLVRQVA